jgi:hypothetical protein
LAFPSPGSTRSTCRASQRHSSKLVSSPPSPFSHTNGNSPIIRRTETGGHGRRAQFHFYPRHCAGCQHHQRSPCHGGIHQFRPERFPSLSPTPAPIRARSIWRQPATEVRNHVSGELFWMLTGLNMVIVPCRGGAPAVPIWSADRCVACVMVRIEQSIPARRSSIPPSRTAVILQSWPHMPVSAQVTHAFQDPSTCSSMARARRFREACGFA